MELAASPLPHGSVPPRSESCAELVTEVAGRIAARTDELAEQLVDRIADEMPEIGAREHVREGLVRVARGCVTLLSAMTRSWSDPRSVPPPPEAVEWSRSLVRSGLPVDAVLRTFRLGQSGYWDVWHQELSTAGDDPEVLLEALRATAAFTFIWVDTIIAPLSAAYEEEHERLVRGEHAFRVETIEGLLRGEVTDSRLASLRLGYDIERPLHAFVVWAEGDAPAGPVADLEDLALAVAEVLAPDGASRPLLHRLSPHLLHAWVASAACGVEQATAIEALLSGRDARVAIGGPGTGAEGFRDAHAEANGARRVARLLRRGAAVTRYEEVAVADLLTRDPDAARHVARRVLGPLAAADDGSRRLLETLRVFLEEGQSYVRAGRRLGVHQNTVAYRVRRATALVGQDDADPLRLRTAVELSPLLAP